LPIVLVVIFLFVLGFSLLDEHIRSSIQPLISPETPSQGGAVEVEMVSADTYKGSDGSETTNERRETSTESCDDVRVLVDRLHPLPPGYTPEDLVSLQSYGVPSLGSIDMTLRREAAEHLKDLVSAAAVDDEELVVASAYRSYEDQQVSYDRLSSVYGPEADLKSALPGHSQHQLGTAIDFTNAAASYQVWEPFGYTTAARWLSSHAYEHGFVLAYPSGKEEETGYEWEPWHYRYVGTGNARRLAESGLTLHEFLVSEGVLPSC
jgi:D-alanyl-D-alanine carboxypeptidase